MFKRLLERGYQVRGLSRTQEGADRLPKEHAKFADNFEIVVGTLTDYDLLEREARRSDVVIHCGFIHDFTKFDESIETSSRSTTRHFKDPGRPSLPVRVRA